MLRQSTNNLMKRTDKPAVFQSPGNMPLTRAQMRHYVRGAFAMLELCRLEGIPDNKGLVEILAGQTGIKPPADYGDHNGGEG